MDNECIVDLKGIKKSFSGVDVLKGVDLTLKKGEIVALMGENGAGKSTLVNVLMGVHKRDGGVIKINGREFTEYNINTARQNGIAMIPQELALVPAISVAENIFMSGRLGKSGVLSQKQMCKKAAEIIEELGFDIDPEARVDSLPISYRQLVSIVKVIAEDASVIIMDEPTSALDPISTSKIEELAMELKKRYTIVIVTHNMQQALRISDSTAFFLLGELIEYDNTEKLFSVPSDKRTEDYITGRFG